MGDSPDFGEGLWPSPKLTELLLMRWADRITADYELDDEKRAEVRKAVVRRWGTFLSEHRPELQPLLNEFIEMRMGLEPPPKQRVQAWAKRAAPVFDRLEKQLNEGAAEFRELLPPSEQARFGARVLQLGIGLQFARQKLARWQEGEFEPDEFWQEPRWQRRQRRERNRRAEAEEATRQVVDPITDELRAWDKYVADFIRLYDLDEGQRGAVLSVLSELKERAVNHKNRHHEEIARLEARISSFSGADDELAELKKQLTELYGPIDAMFQELKRRIEPIPTGKQRASAAPKAETQRGAKNTSNPQNDSRPE